MDEILREEGKRGRVSAGVLLARGSWGGILF